MQKESAPQQLEYPKGTWLIQISRDKSNWVDIGDLYLEENEQSSKPFVGAILFKGEEKTVGNLAGKPFPVDVQDYEPQTGYIRFQILAAATVFKPGTAYPYRFFFEGSCEANKLGAGSATVPKDFGGESRLPEEDGDNVTWRRGGPGQPDDSSN
jgi:hypothetical protein